VPYVCNVDYNKTWFEWTNSSRSATPRAIGRGSAQTGVPCSSTATETHDQKQQRPQQSNSRAQQSNSVPSVLSRATADLGQSSAEQQRPQQSNSVLSRATAEQPRATGEAPQRPGCGLSTAPSQPGTRQPADIALAPYSENIAASAVHVRPRK